jgi:flagellar assembly protein FliH
VSAARQRAWREASEVLEEAVRRAEEMLELARRDAREIRRRAADEGRAEGERAWAEAAVALAEARAREAGAREDECVRLAVAIARRIVGGAIDADPGLAERLARLACGPLRREAPLRLTVPPSAAARASAVRAALGEWPAVEILEDPALGPGDCVAECGGVRVDATLDTQLAVIEARLLGVAGPREAP